MAATAPPGSTSLKPTAPSQLHSMLHSRDVMCRHSPPCALGHSAFGMPQPGVMPLALMTAPAVADRRWAMKARAASGSLALAATAVV